MSSLESVCLDESRCRELENLEKDGVCGEGSEETVGGSVRVRGGCKDRRR